MRGFLGKRLFSVKEVAELTGFVGESVKALVPEIHGATRQIGERVYITEVGVRAAFDMTDHEFHGFVEAAKARDTLLKLAKKARAAA